MISFITGKPGDGKSLFATLLLLEVLITSEAFVVTNIPLRLGPVNAYVTRERKRRGIEEPFDIHERVKVLPDSEVFEFYRHRSGGLVLPESPDFVAEKEGTRERLQKPEFVAEMKRNFSRIRGSASYQRPVHYFIDEAHTFFDSREWANTGRGLTYYASQHRHLHDEVYLITQVMENVETRLRKLCSETHAVRNQLRRRIGPIRMRPVFRVKSYYGVPTTNVRPFAEKTFPLDVKGVASCYQTVGAMGIHSTPEEQKNKAPLPWWVLPVLGVLAVLAIAGAIMGLPLLGGKMGRMVATGAGQGVLQAVGSPIGAGTKSERERAGPELPPRQPGPMDAGSAGGRVPGQKSDTMLASRQIAPVTVTGYVARNGTATVWLSDGRVLTEIDLRRIDPRFVETRDGARFYLSRSRVDPSTLKLGAGLENFRGTTPATLQTPSPQSQRDEGAWVRGIDGVSRIKESVGLQGSLTR